MILLTSEEANGKIKTYSYDNNGNRIGFSLAVNGENVINTTYTFDMLNRLATVTNNGETTTYAYDNNGNLLLSQTGENAVTYEYNNANMLKSQTNNTLGITYGATYYLNGNRRTLDETNKPQIVYTYDDFGKLINENASDYVINYSYDNRGNRTQKAKTELGLTETTTYSYDKNNKLLQEYQLIDNVEHITDYTYDNNGNQIITNYYTLAENDDAGVIEANVGPSYYTHFYDYDNFNRLIKSSVNDSITIYEYDGNNLRQSKTTNGVKTSHIYDGQNIVLDITDSGNTVYNRGLSLINRTNQNGTDYYHFNIHGDTVALTDINNQLTVNYQYDAFGNQLTDNTNDTNPFRYCGEYFDTETGFVYLRNRYYDPSLGRFVTEDPIKDGINWYVYANNNPVMFVDPEGLEGQSYIFYDSQATSGDGKHTFEDEAEIYMKMLKEKYGNDYTVNMVPVKSAYEFKAYWNDDSNMQGKIDEVYIILHGSIDDDKIGYMYFSDDRGKKIYAELPQSIDYSKSFVVSQLKRKYIHRLTFSSCNSANPDAHNMVDAFKTQMNIYQITGWDGGTYFDYGFFGGKKLKAGASGKKNQTTWYKYVQKYDTGKPARLRYGKRVFYQVNGVWSEDTSVRDDILETDI